MIVGTAGHIDHGKTTLVRALTGVNTDRLKEEQERGISIELGYAYVPLANGEVLGFIDVPGHERLIHTMVAGACGIDFALLVVAADDGVMPQTREHLAILELLGVARGAVALTKADRVEPIRLETVRAEVTALLAPTPLRDAPVFSLNATAHDDPGTSALKDYLSDVATHGGSKDYAGVKTGLVSPRSRSGVHACRTRYRGDGNRVFGPGTHQRYACGDAPRHQHPRTQHPHTEPSRGARIRR